jgi:hypothetical protein
MQLHGMGCLRADLDANLQRRDILLSSRCSGHVEAQAYQDSQRLHVDHCAREAAYKLHKYRKLGSQARYASKQPLVEVLPLVDQVSGATKL